MRWVIPGVAALVLAADQISKSLILAAHATAAGNGWIAFRLVRNTGVSGGIASGYPVLVTLTALVIAAGAVTFAVRVRSRAAAVCLAAVCGGALGNLSDRVFRSPGFGRGAVVDWIHVMGRGGSFNIADTAIQFGALIAIFAMFAAERARKAAERAGQRESGWPVRDKGSGGRRGRACSRRPPSSAGAGCCAPTAARRRSRPFEGP